MNSKFNSRVHTLFTVFCLGLLSACTGHDNHYSVQPLPALQSKHLRSLAIAGNFLGPNDPLPLIPESKEEACNMRIRDLPADYISGWLRVPEDPADLNGQQISIFYYGRVKADPQIQQDVTIFFNGGPGSDSEGSFSHLSDLQQTSLEYDKVNFLFIDQRGNGCSDPYPQGDTPEVLKRLTHYGTRGIVADAEVVREHLLGKQKWRVFGQSYGAYIVHKYAIVSPQSIRQAYAHANAITDSPILRHAERIASQDRVLQEYLKTYPDDQERLLILNRHLQKKPCFVVDEEKKYCGYTLSVPLVMMLGFHTAWEHLHQWLGGLINSDLSLNVGKLETLAKNYLIDEDPGNNKNNAQAVIAYTDRKYYDADGKLCAKAFKELSARGLKPESFLLDECKDEMAIYSDGSLGDQDTADYSNLLKLPTDWMTSKQLKDSLAKNPALKFNLYSGELDCFVPVANFFEELGVVRPLVKYMHFTGSGHDGFASEPQVWRDLID